jgi:hypothetical protein
MYRGLGVKCPLRVGPACDNSFRFVVAAIRVAIAGDFVTIRNGRETLTIQIHASPGAHGNRKDVCAAAERVRKG